MNGRKDKENRLRLINWDSIDGNKDIPVIRAENAVLPSDLLPFNMAMSSRNYGGGVHFFIDDYQFERIWRRPEAYLGRFRKFSCVFSPDFSLYADMPYPMKLWNVFRSRLLGSWWQSQGISVIPSVSWAGEESFEYCFDGLEKGGYVAISSTGAFLNRRQQELWRSGAEEMSRRLQPKAILLYGSKVNFNSSGADVLIYRNKILDRLRKIR